MESEKHFEIKSIDKGHDQVPDSEDKTQANPEKKESEKKSPFLFLTPGLK